MPINLKDDWDNKNNFSTSNSSPRKYKDNWNIHELTCYGNKKIRMKV